MNALQAVPPIGASAAEAEVSLRSITAGFPGRAPVLQRLSLDVKPGEIVGLVGESGSGKSFLARTIMGKMPRGAALQDGNVFFRNQPVYGQQARPPKLGIDMAMIVANPQGEINPVEPVGIQIANLIQYHFKVGRSEAAKRAIDMLKAVSIPDPERRFYSYAHQLSGGMAQRIVIAMALCCDPGFLIADDATSGLDVTVQTQVLNLLRAMVAERNASALIITRDISIVAHYCHRIAVLHRGEIVETARVGDFFDRPKHPYSNRLLAAFSYNQRLKEQWVRPDLDDADTEIGAGCAYRFRCPRRAAACDIAAPPLVPSGPHHLVSCYFPAGSVQ